jgi:pentatricopeptide repeat protein
MMHNILIHGLCSAGKVDEASRLLSEMKEKNNCRPNLVTYNTLMYGFYETGCFDKAASIWTAIIKNGMVPDIISYNTRIKGLCSCHRTPEGVQLLEELVARGIIPTVITWNILVRAVIKYGPIQI